MITNQTHKTNMRRTRRRGFTLTEIAIVLGIVGLILGSIWVAAAAVYNNMRVAHANTAILQIVQATRGLYSTSNTIAAGIQTGNLAQAGVIPGDLGPAALVGPWIDQWPGGFTDVVGNPLGDGFTIVLTSVPQTACIALMVQVGGQSSDPGLYQASAVATAAAAAADAVASGPRIPAVAPAAAAVACPAGLDKVRFGFSLKT